ncbi:hypothetical protein CAPTEDRAFT_148012 [Capitella teleta]|uniref:Uncharacterized protein n=1 Tax=Capitella teleta TaxID=283909 RepID=R7T544_CAPTE|nr:hypothetical protein CAPTEDRAFT_148012 [Capitella teleta]|eukprot:ELT88312.1 hypothetical protein CAPTEDRAFT_148012 [Capitella teleta]
MVKEVSPMKKSFQKKSKGKKKSVDIVETPISTKPAAWDREGQDTSPSQLDSLLSVRSSTKKVRRTSSMNSSVMDERRYPSSKYYQTPSGTFIISSLEGTDSPSLVKSRLKRGNKEYEMVSSPAVMCVEPAEEEKKVVSVKKGKKQRKRQAQQEEEEHRPAKLTGKEKRKQHREARTKKIGQHFYTSANVKNRSYRD